MRFMLLLKGDPPTDPQGNATPPEKLIDAMQRYLEELAKAGVLLAAEGLQPSATGARVVYAKGERRVIDGPFTEAMEWARRCPVDYAVQGDQEAVVEVRQVADMADLPTATDEQRATDQRLRDQLSGW